VWPTSRKEREMEREGMEKRQREATKSKAVGRYSNSIWR